jgi:hypothetical protein
MVSGISPVRLFSEMSSSCIFLSFPNSIGRLPVREFCDEKRNTNEERPISCGGITPLRLFRDIVINCKFWQFPIFGGMFPSNSFAVKMSVDSCVRFPMEDGIHPDNLL